jgi:hypothetical protein
VSAGQRSTGQGSTGQRSGGPALTGAFNFRDLGGLPTADGRRTRPGRLFRSDTLQALTEADVTHLVESLGVMLVIDLRDSDEAVEQGRGLLGQSSLGYVNLPLKAAPAAAGTTQAGLAPAGLAPAGLGSATSDFYAGHLESSSLMLPLARLGRVPRHPRVIARPSRRAPARRRFLARPVPVTRLPRSAHTFQPYRDSGGTFPVDTSAWTFAPCFPRLGFTIRGCGPVNRTSGHTSPVA